MKRVLVFLSVFFALGCIIPNAVAQASKGAAAEQCIPRDTAGKPCTPPAKKQATHTQQHRQIVQSTATSSASSAATATPNATDKLVELLATSTVANQQRETDAFIIAQQALKLQAETDAKRIAIEDHDANTRQYVAEHNYALEERRVTYEELNAEAQRKYLPQYARAALLDAKAHMTDAILGNAIRAGGQIGAAMLLQPTQVTSNATGGAGGNSSASAAQTQQQTASPSQSQSQVAP
jgi:hypothetical protein